MLPDHSVKGNFFIESHQFYKEVTEEEKGENQPIPDIEKALMKYILENTEKNHPRQILDKIDEFSSKHSMMHIGKEKAAIVNFLFEKYKPTNILEIGTYCGYSSLLLAELSQEQAMIHTLEVNEQFANIAKKIHDHSGMQNKINIHLGEVSKSEEYLNSNAPFDFILIDHWKDIYVRDLKLLREFGVLKKGHLIFADNIIKPGAPEYLQFMKAHEQYGNTLYHTLNWASKSSDAVLVSQSLI